MKKLIEIAAVDITIYKFVLPLMHRLRQEGWEISVAASDVGYKEKIEEQGYRVHPVDIPRNLSPLALGMALIQIIRMLRSTKPDYIHVHTPIASILARIAAKIIGVPKVVYTLHGIYMKPPFLQIEKVMCKYCTDFIFTVNEEDRKYLIRHGYQSEKNIMNINSVGIDIHVFDPKRFSEEDKTKLKEELRIQENAPIIGFVGRLVREKGVLELLEAFLQLRNQIKCKLLLVGSAALGERDAKTFEILQQRVQESSVSEDIIFAGHQEDIPYMLSIMDVFVLPSHREGMPVSILEAMAMELPVVATDIRGCREEITVETGILVPVDDIAELHKAIMTFLSSKEEREQKGFAGRRRVQQFFEMGSIVEKQVRVLVRKTTKIF